MYSTDCAGLIRQSQDSHSINLGAENYDGEKIMSKMLMFRILPFLGLLIGAPCQAETAYPAIQRSPTTTYPQYYGYGGVAATPVPIPRPIYQRQYPRRYGPNHFSVLPVPIPGPSVGQPTTSYRQHYGYGGNVAATPVPIPRPIYQRRYPRRYGPNPVGGLPIPIPAPSYGDQFTR